MKTALTKIAVLLLAAICQTACVANDNKTTKGETKANRCAVVYFSATGTTKNAAVQLAKEANADLIEIVPQKAYTAGDLDWHDKQSRSTIEMKNDKARPALKKAKQDLTKYQVIYLGYPIWWNQAPRAVNTFIEANSLKGKKVVPFATSGGSSIEHSVATLKKTYPNINWQEGHLLNDLTKANIKSAIAK